MLPIIDMHCDTISMIMNKDIGQSFGIRRNGMNVDLERMKESGYMCQVFALYTNMERAAKTGLSPLEYALRLSDIFDSEISANADLIRPVQSAEEIVRNHNAGYMSALKSIEEGAVYEGKIENLQLFYDKGVRMSTLTWNYVNNLAYPNPPAAINGRKIVYRYDREHGLTNIGKEFVQAMEEMGIVIDLSHLNDGGILDVFSIVKADTPVIASHSNARGLCGAARNLSDNMIRLIGEHGGVAGINFCGKFLRDEGIDEDRRYDSSIEDIISHIGHIKNIGGIESVALGTDFDGISGRLQINGAGEMTKLAAALSDKGYKPDEIEKIFYKNVLRVFRNVIG